MHKLTLCKNWQQHLKTKTNEFETTKTLEYPAVLYLTMVHKVCELCRTGTSSKWRTITLNVAQNVLDGFDIQVSVGKLICNACQIKLSKEKKENESNKGQNERLSVPSRGEKYVTKANIPKQTRVENFKGKVCLENTISFGNVIMPHSVILDILVLLDIKSIMKFSECCKAIDNLLTQGLWKKLIA